jgi:sugar O-acyltransferase (sialic acid O-acetyltransferase NeuD family)
MSVAFFGVFGAGGFAREVMPWASRKVSERYCLEGLKIESFFVIKQANERHIINGFGCISERDFFNLPGRKFCAVAIADSKIREEIAIRIGALVEVISIFETSTEALRDCNVGEGAIFCPHTTFSPNSTIGKFFHGNLYSYVAHDCMIGDFVTFAPRVTCSGNVHIEDHVYVGAGAVIRDGKPGDPIRIGKGATIGMGAVVTKSVPAGITVVGNPARIL